MSPNEARRRQVLGSLTAAVGFGLAGCSGSTGGDPDTETGTETPCRADPPPTPDGDRSYPDPPTELRPATVKEFAKAYERVYQSAVEPGFRSLQYEQEPTVEKQSTGYHVWLACWLRTGPASDAETPRRPIGDEFYTAAYAMTERKVARAEGASDGRVDGSINPSDGRVVACR